jgi:serine/threonine-protein kinase
MSTEETLPAPPDPSLPTIPGYQLVRLVSRSGLGSAYEARQLGLDRTVTLKIIHTENARELLRLRAQADSVAAVCHPNVVQVYEHAEHLGQVVLTLEHVPGGTLAEHLQDLGRIIGKPAATLVLGIARGLGAAHAQQLVHGDLKAANILLDDAGEAKVADLELAALREPGTFVGHPAHMPPELLRGTARFIGPTVDVWSLGVILYRCITGRPPFQADDAGSLIHAICTQQPELPSQLVRELPRDVEAVCMKCLAKNPTERYSSASEVAEELARYLAGEPVLARVPGPAGRVVKWSRRNPVAAALLLLTTVALATFLLLWQHAEKNLAATNAALDAEQNHLAELTAVRDEIQQREAAERKRADDTTTQFQTAQQSTRELARFTTEVLSLVSVANQPMDAATQSTLLDALRASRRVATSPQGTPAMRVQLAAAYVHIGNAFEKHKHFAEAADLYREAIELTRPVAVGLPEVRGPISGLGVVLMRQTAARPLALALAQRGAMLVQLGKAADAVPLLIEAETLDRLEMGASEPPERPYWRGHLCLHLTVLAEANRILGQRGDAVRALQEARGLVQANVDYLRLIAGNYALLAASTDDAKEKEESLTEAIEALRAAVQAGWRSPAERHYRPFTIDNADFAAFRDNPEVKKLLADAAKKE